MMEGLVNLLTDSITLSPQNIAAPTPDGLKSGVTLKEHQKIGLSWMKFRENHELRGGTVADDMGLGKTLLLISLMLDDKNRREADTPPATNDQIAFTETYNTLVIAPLTLIETWKNEIDKFVAPNRLTATIYHGQNRQLDLNYDVVITTYDAAKDSNIATVKWWRVVLDEAHIIRNPKSLIAKAICNLDAVNRWAVTGTPINNTHLDMYSLMRFLKVTPLNNKNTWEELSKSQNFVSCLKLIAKAFFLRRTKVEINPETGEPFVPLPPRLLAEVPIEFTKEERQLYDNMFPPIQQEVRSDIQNNRKPRYLEKTISLQQACIHFNLTIKNKLFEKSYKSAKLRYLFQLLERIDTDDKVVIVSQWIKVLDLIERHLDSSNITSTTINGNVKKTEERSRRVDSFNSPEGPRVMLLSLKAGGVGLTLTGANHLVLIEPHWNPAVEQQAFERIHRIGQTKDVFIYKLYCRDTIDEQVMQVSKEKLEFSNDVLTPDSEANYSLEEVTTLFALED